MGLIESGEIDFSSETHDVEACLFGLVKQWKIKHLANIKLKLLETTLKNLVRALGGDVTAISDSAYLGGLFAKTGWAEIQVCIPYWDDVDPADFSATSLEKAYTFWNCKATGNVKEGLDPKGHKVYEIEYNAFIRNPEGTETEDFTSYHVKSDVVGNLTADGSGYEVA